MAPDLTLEEMRRVHERDVRVKQRLADRIAVLTLENTELIGIVEELQSELVALKDSPVPAAPQD